MKQHLAHQDEERDRNERELRDRELLVANHLLQTGIAAEDQIRADDIDGEEDESDGKRGEQQSDLGREHEAQDRAPAHSGSSDLMPGMKSDLIVANAGAACDRA